MDPIVQIVRITQIAQIVQIAQIAHTVRIVRIIQIAQIVQIAEIGLSGLSDLTEFPGFRVAVRPMLTRPAGSGARQPSPRHQNRAIWLAFRQAWHAIMGRPATSKSDDSSSARWKN